jgi:hypothetical protein
MECLGGPAAIPTYLRHYLCWPVIEKTLGYYYPTMWLMIFVLMGKKSSGKI